MLVASWSWLKEALFRGVKYWGESDGVTKVTHESRLTARFHRVTRESRLNAPLHDFEQLSNSTRL